MKKLAVLLGVVLILGLAGVAGATLVPLSDTSQTTTFSATVSEQADVSVPATVTFDVVNVNMATGSSPQSVTATSIVLDDGKTLKIWLKADGSDFSKPTGGTVTWTAGDVSWDNPEWTGGTGSSGTLSTTDGEVAQSTANAPELSTATLVFTLAAKPTVDRAGDHTLSATWKFESFGP